MHAAPRAHNLALDVVRITREETWPCAAQRSSRFQTPGGTAPRTDDKALGMEHMRTRGRPQPACAVTRRLRAACRGTRTRRATMGGTGRAWARAWAPRHCSQTFMQLRLSHRSPALRSLASTSERTECRRGRPTSSSAACCCYCCLREMWPALASRVRLVSAKSEKACGGAVLLRQWARRRRARVWMAQGPSHAVHA